MAVISSPPMPSAEDHGGAGEESPPCSRRAARPHRPPAACPTRGQLKRIGTRRGKKPEAQAAAARGQRERADDRRRGGGREAALYQVGRLVQRNPRLHRVGKDGEQGQQPEGAGAQGLGRVKCGSGVGGVVGLRGGRHDGARHRVAGRRPRAHGRSAARWAGSRPQIRRRPRRSSRRANHQTASQLWAISGRQTRPIICEVVAIALAVVRRAMNQLFTAP